MSLNNVFWLGSLTPSCSANSEQRCVTKLLGKTTFHRLELAGINLSASRGHPAMLVSLIPMSEASFLNYLEQAIPSYAQVNIDSGRWQETGALTRSKQSHDRFLPDGLKTKNNYLFNIIEHQTSQAVGHTWLEIQNSASTKAAFIFDIEIYPMHRRQGYAKSSLGCIEKLAASLGAITLGLHVF